MKLGPNETRIVDFVLVWHFPNHMTSFKTSLPTGKNQTVTKDTQYAFDGNPDSRWSTNRAMIAGDTYKLNLGALHCVSRLTLDSRESPHDYPHGYRIEVSCDGTNWKTAAVATPAQAAMAQHQGYLDIKFSKQKAKLIRIVDTGGSTNWNWSIHELSIYDASGRELSSKGWKAAAYLAQMKAVQKTENVGHFYSNRFKNAAEIADYVFNNTDRLLGDTREWQDIVRKSNLPDWLRLKLVNCAFSIYACGIFTKDGRFAVMESPVDMSGATGTMDQRMAAHAFYTQMFPELDMKELRMYAKCQDLVKPYPDGRITHFDGNIHEVIGDPNIGYGVTDWPDLSTSWMLQVIKLYRWTGDRKFVDDMWPHVKWALEWLKSEDMDGDLIPEGGSTYDYDALPRGAFCYNADCYLAALRCGIHMARIEGDKVAEKAYTDRFRAVQASYMKNLWNGKYFDKFFNQKTGIRVPNSFIAQLAGDWLSRLSGCGPTLAPGVIDSTMREIIARHVKPFFPVPPMEVTPEGKLATGACYMLQHEPYVGCEAINEGYTDDGLDVIKRVYDVAWELNRNPWH